MEQSLGRQTSEVQDMYYRGWKQTDAYQEFKTIRRCGVVCLMFLRVKFFRHSTRSRVNLNREYQPHPTRYPAIATTCSYLQHQRSTWVHTSNIAVSALDLLQKRHQIVCMPKRGVHTCCIAWDTRHYQKVDQPALPYDGLTLGSCAIVWNILEGY